MKFYELILQVLNDIRYLESISIQKSIGYCLEGLHKETSGMRCFFYLSGFKNF